MTAPMPPLGLYCHVPFCVSTCDFCAFYQEKPRRGDIARYLDGVERELELQAPDRAASTFFWGGGTPGILAPEDLSRLGRAFLRANGTAPAEWTVEVAPATVTRPRLAALRELGVTRVSMGVQSFDAATLSALGRQHTPRQIYQAYEWIQEAGFRDTSLDLIFAVPGQDEARWSADLAEAVRLAPHHISTYCLTFEEDTALYVKLSRGRVSVDAERDAALYRTTWAFLEERGYAQYEISNFARAGHACVHNLNTWRMAEWLGYGPAAASQWGGRRFQNPANLERWLGGVAAGDIGAVREQVVPLTASSLLADAIVFGLRMNEGITLAALEQRFGATAPAALHELGARLVEEGLFADGTDCWRLTLEGRLRADAIGVALLECFDGTDEKGAGGVA
ncbi:MAG: radical SAM family heme chaperone HemW [Puniceicoccales bacterium]|jgi:oxygen-independent coproporphyrinogen-3 oxidase|nr:radical SAM family heme chaperone HemW [Puniceicoccales bacterium]